MPVRFIRIVLTAALCLGLAACSGGPPEPPQAPLAGRSGNYNTQAVIRYKELSATAIIAQKTPESCSLNFTSPDSLKDMAFVFHRDSVDVSFKGSSFRFDPRSVPGGAVANVTVTAISKALQDDGITVNRTDQGTELTGMLGVGEFTLSLDPESGSLVKLSVPSEELEIEFQNFRFLD